MFHVACNWTPVVVQFQCYQSGHSAEKSLSIGFDAASFAGSNVQRSGVSWTGFKTSLR
jgi:hypothetical protein